MLYEDRQIPELNYMKHRHDSDNDYFDYQSNILNNSLSPYMFNNNMMNTFLLKLQKPLAMMFDKFNIVKNFKNYIVDKSYYKHKD